MAGGTRNGQPLWRTWSFLRELNGLSPSDPEIKLLCVYSNELKTYVRAKACTLMFLCNHPDGKATMWFFSVCTHRPWSSRQGNIVRHWKEMSHEAMKRQGGTLDVYY